MPWGEARRILKEETCICFGKMLHNLVILLKYIHQIGKVKIKIVLDQKLKDTTKNIDFSELCITSKAMVTYNESTEVIVETIKAKGTKCPTCWKINDTACQRTTCPKLT